jgi:diguanylate cyclase (GGDEF)-like protein
MPWNAWAAEEFAVLLAGAEADVAEAYAHELRALVVGDAAASGMPFTVSVGVAALPREGACADGLLAAADAALYCAKRAGHDTVGTACSFNP